VEAPWQARESKHLKVNGLSEPEIGGTKCA